MARLPPDSPVPAYGSLVGSWIVGKRLGCGSYGTVFRAAHQDRPEDEGFALKLAMRTGDERFEREAWLLSRIRHPSVPRFEASGTWRCPEGEAYPYVVMQRVEGMNPYAWAMEHGLTVRQAISQLAQVARALQAVHQHGVHRDVKGGNIRVSDEGHAVLLDFGSSWYPGASSLTGRQMPPGTGEYRSPQLQLFEFALESGVNDCSYKADAADDVYALGVTAYRLLAGDYPRLTSDSSEGLKEPEPLKPPRGLEQVCPELGDLLMRMLSQDDPRARGSAAAIAEELEALLEYSREALDEPWVANASRQPTEKAPLPSAPEEPALRLAPVVPSKPALSPALAVAKEPASCLALAGAFAVLVLLVVVLAGDRVRSEVASTEPGRTPHAAGSPDAGPSGVGEEALASVTQAETPVVSEKKVTREVPREPLDDQRRPPCTDPRVVAINGGCWRIQATGADIAPCASDLYEHEGRCYAPVFIGAKRVPTSKDP